MTASDDGAPGDPEPFKIAIIGAGFAGVAAAYHLMLRCAEGLDDSPAAPTATADALPTSRRRPVEVHLFDEKGIAGGASGVAAGLLHPYTPRGKIIWRGVEGVAATLALVAAAEDAETRLDSGAAVLDDDDDDGGGPHDRRGESIARRRGTVRPARNLKQARDLAKHAPLSAAGGGVAVDAATLRAILPGVVVPNEVESAAQKRTDGAPADAKEVTRRVENGTGRPGEGAPGRGTNARDRRAAAKRASCEESGEETAAAAALHVPGGVVLDSTRYLRALWNATRLLASSDRTPIGCVARVRVERAVRSLTRDERVVSGGFDACVVACGAAVGSIAELSGPSCSLPLTNQGGHVVELVPKPGAGASPWDERTPGILGAPYVAPLGVGRLLVGATKEFDAGVGDARRAGVVDPGVDDAAQEAAHALVADASATYPPLKGMEVDAVRYGVRANPPRTPAGSLPLVGRIEGIGEGGDGDGDGEAGRRSWWFVGGLGARGLVYHAMLGAIVAEAVMRGDPSGIPAELRFDPRVVST